MRPLSSIEGHTLIVPGLVSAHSHAFQHALRGKTQRATRDTGTFWSWREAMYQLADSLTPESIERVSRRAFEELRATGVVAVGEFHYVHHQPGGAPYDDRTALADAVIRAALAADLRITLLRVAYHGASPGQAPEGAQRRFSDPSPDLVLRDVDTLVARWKHEPRVRVGLAPHSVRAVPAAWIKELHGYARSHAMPFHMHVAEVQGEVDTSLGHYGRRPVELLADLEVLDARFVAVHAVCLEAHEARLLGEARAFVCVCPTTERDLGDGMADLAALRDAGARLCVGIDSHVVTDPVEEMRALEMHERLRLRRRVTFTPPEGRTPAEQLVVEGSVLGALACGWDASLDPRATDWRPSTYVDLDARPLAGVERDEALDAWIFSGGTACVVSDRARG
jgi:formiminoglutamate deiminase